MGTITVQGLNIFFREAGKPSNPKLVFLHGFPASSHQYRNLLPALADTFHVIAMDYPGFGNSDMPDPASYPYTFDTTAEVVQAFLSNTHDRALGIHIAPPSPPGQYLESWVEILFVKGFDAGQPIVYISTDAGQPLSAVLERSTYVPALDQAAYNGGDDFLGSARERLFGFVNGQTGADNREAQGFVHLVRDGHAAEDASASNTALIDALRNGGDLLNVFGDFPTETDPRHANAYSPLWDAQLGLWTDKAVKAGLNRRQIDESRSSTWRPPGRTC